MSESDGAEPSVDKVKPSEAGRASDDGTVADASLEGEHYRDLAQLDRLIHEPARLAITSALAACERADFVFLRTLTGLSRGNLSSHLSRLEEAGVVAVEKRFEGKVPRTWIELTTRGHSLVAEYWEQMDQMAQLAQGGGRGKPRSRTPADGGS